MRLKMLFYIIIACCWGKTLSLPQHLINEFKASLLPIFGLKDRPKLEGGQKPQIPEALRELYEVQNNMEYDTASLPLPGLHTRSANTVRSFTHVESPIDEKFLHHHKFRLKFDVASIPKHEKLKAAEIKFKRDAIITDSTPYQRLLVHEILQPGRKGSHGPIMRLIDSQVIDTRQNTSISVDVFPAVERWLSDPKSNHGVFIVLRGGDTKKIPPKKHLRLKRDVDIDDWWQNQPLLFTYTDDGKNKQRTGMELTKLRPKRSSTKKQPKKDRDPCRRRQMYVDFRDVGWNDWIVAPLGYDAFYCAGSCDYPMPEHLNTTNHAIVQSLFNSMKPNEVPKPCCVPTQLSSMSMLYVSSTKNIILKNYKDMVVVGCGCR